MFLLEKMDRTNQQQHKREMRLKEKTLQEAQAENDTLKAELFIQTNGSDGAIETSKVNGKEKMNPPRTSRRNSGSLAGYRIKSPSYLLPTSRGIGKTDELLVLLLTIVLQVGTFLLFTFFFLFY